MSIVCSAGAQDDGVITSWNEGAHRLFGHDASAVLGRPADVIVPEHVRDAHWAGFRRAMEAPQIKDMAADLPVLRTRRCGSSQAGCSR